MQQRPTPRRLHPDATLQGPSLEFWRKQATDDILRSLETGKLGPSDVGEMILKGDGTIMNGNTRIKALEERGFDLDRLWEIVDRKSGGSSAAQKAFDDLFND